MTSMQHTIPELQIGKITLFYERGALQMGILTDFLNTNVVISLKDGSSISLNPCRIVLFSSHCFPPYTESLDSFAKAVSSAKRLVVSQPLSINGEAFHEVCIRLSIVEDSHKFALFMHIKDHPELYFQKHELFYSRESKDTEAYLRLQTERRLREDYLSRIESFLAAVSNDETNIPISKEDNSLLAKDVQALLQGDKCEDLELRMHKCGAIAPLKAYLMRIRKALGDVGFVPDPPLEESGIPIAFPIYLEEMYESPQSDQTTPIEAFCIDDDDTLDYDDALSIQPRDTGYRIGIHVSNIATSAGLYLPILSTAINRVSSLYLPSGVVPMLPKHLSEDSFSLKAGKPKTVLSLYACLDAEFNLISKEIKFDEIIVTENFTYNRVDSLIQEYPFKTLKGITDALREHRDSSQKTPKKRYHYLFKVLEKDVILKRIDNLSPSRLIVEELMILYNRILAEEATAHKLPMIFRNVNQYLGLDDEVISSSAFLSSSPGYHPGIGAEAYLHITSPIRRAVDLINQIQICSFAKNQKPHFTTEDINKLIPQIEKRIILHRQTASKSELYWCLQYIAKNNLNQPMEGYLRGYTTGKIRVEIIPWSKQVFLVTEGTPQDECFSFVPYSIDWDTLTIKADLLN